MVIIPWDDCLIIKSGESLRLFIVSHESVDHQVRVLNNGARMFQCYKATSPIGFV
jgi:hypothetical protein